MAQYYGLETKEGKTFLVAWSGREVRVIEAGDSDHTKVVTAIHPAQSEEVFRTQQESGRPLHVSTITEFDGKEIWCAGDCLGRVKKIIAFS